MAREVKGPSATSARRSSSVLSLMTGWVQQGIDSFLSTQKILIELAMRKNESAMKTIRDALSDPEHSPMAIMTEVAVEGTANFIEVQRILLNLLQQENDIVLAGIRDRLPSARAVAMTDALRRGIDTVVEMQQDYLTMVSKQTQNFIEPMMSGKGYDVSHLADVAREAMDNFVHSQKKFLDMVAEETERITAGKPAVRKAAPKELSKLAHESATALVDSQKKLLDLAGHQMDVSRDVVNRTKDLLMPFQVLPVSSFAERGIKTFVDAEEALVDRVTGTRKAPVAHARPRRARTTRRKPAAKAAASA